MIGVFPKPYEDELAYSVFARYFSMSGYQCFSSVAEDLYTNPKNKPSIEFINPLSQDAINYVVGFYGSLDEFILKHTMFNYYSTFLPHSRKQQAFEFALKMEIKSLMNALPIPQSKASRYLRYCPLCVKEDRNQYGETFWHRSHQINGVNVCYKHECYLVNSSVPISSNMPPSLIKAELEVKKHNTTNKALPKKIEVDIAKYNIELLNHNHLSTLIYNNLSENLNAYLIGTKYLSSRGAKRYIQKLSLDFKEFYKDVDLSGFGEEWQLEKLFNGYRLNSFEISLVGMFLGIQPNDITNHQKSLKINYTKDFDRNIAQLKSDGYNYKEISEILGISYDYCKFLGSGKSKSHSKKSSHSKGGMRVCWQTLDEETLPRVIDLVTELKSADVRKPQAISVGKVERLLGLKEQQLKHLPKCLEYVNNNIISQEEFWALTIAWAIRKLKSEDKTIHKTNITKLTNIRNKNIINAFSYLTKYLDDETVKQLERLFLD